MDTPTIVDEVMEQLEAEGKVERCGELWCITPAGLAELDQLEAAQQDGRL